MAKNTKQSVKRRLQKLTEQQVAQVRGGEVLAVMTALRQSGYGDNLAAWGASSGYEGRVTEILR